MIYLFTIFISKYNFPDLIEFLKSSIYKKKHRNEYILYN